MATEPETKQTFLVGDRVRFAGSRNAPNRYDRRPVPDGAVGTAIATGTGLYGRVVIVRFDGMELTYAMLPDEDDRLDLVDVVDA